MEWFYRSLGVEGGGRRRREGRGEGIVERIS